jgi:antitoxin component of MazEF toxin-antitoxin module
MLKIVNVETGEEIEREMTADELAVYNADKAAHETAIAEMKKKTADREALLTKLGITAEEAALLLS